MYQTTCNVLRLSKEQYKVVDTLSFSPKTCIIMDYTCQDSIISTMKHC